MELAEYSMTDLPNIVRERLKASAAGVHPDADLLTAFAEHALPPGERVAVLDHLARCAQCREVIALAIPPLQAAASPVSKDTVRSGKAPWFSWPTLRWGALAAGVVIVGTAVLLQHNTLKMASAPPYLETDTKMQQPQPPVAAPPSGNALVATFDRKVEKKSDELSSTRRSDAGEGSAKPVPGAPSPLASSADLLQENETRVMANKRLQPDAASSTLPSSIPTAPAQSAGARVLTSQGRNSLDAAYANPPSTPKETVEVEASALMLQAEVAKKDEALGKAKPSASGQSGSLVSNLPAPAPNEKALATAEAHRNLRAELYRHRDFGRWTISSDGQLQHSLDSGKTWQPVAVAENAAFRALSANGPDIWVGGAAGLLYHSTDAGAHWTQVKPAVSGAALTTDIAAIEFVDLQHGKITTASGEVWRTADAGQTWQKQP
jgi:hypothetical protein